MNTQAHKPAKKFAGMPDQMVQFNSPCYQIGSIHCLGYYGGAISAHYKVTAHDGKSAILTRLDLLQ
jgi:hypothetical protein